MQATPNLSAGDFPAYSNMLLQCGRFSQYGYCLVNRINKVRSKRLTTLEPVPEELPASRSESQESLSSQREYEILSGSSSASTSLFQSFSGLNDENIEKYENAKLGNIAILNKFINDPMIKFMTKQDKEQLSSSNVQKKFVEDTFDKHFNANEHNRIKELSGFLGLMQGYAKDEKILQEPINHFKKFFEMIK